MKSQVGHVRKVPMKGFVMVFLVLTATAVFYSASILTMKFDFRSTLTFYFLEVDTCSVGGLLLPQPEQLSLNELRIGPFTLQNKSLGLNYHRHTLGHQCKEPVPPGTWSFGRVEPMHFTSNRAIPTQAEGDCCLIGRHHFS